MDRPQNKPIPDIDFPLRKTFGKDAFRPYQREIIIAALQGHDVFVQAATSFGKSLCYQLPAILDHGITIVISPLLALMNDQVAALLAASIPAATINSKTPIPARDAILNDLKCGHPTTRLLYITPEFSQSASFRAHLATVYAQREFARLAIDEAHCISECGHDFRPAYRTLAYFRTTFPLVPIICLTATATPTVRADIVATLGLDPTQLRTFTTTTARPNLHYEVRFTSETHDTRFDYLVAWLRAMHHRRATDPARSAQLAAHGERATAVSGIVYATQRAECDALAARLRGAGIGAAPYHAGMAAVAREAVQARWIGKEPGSEVVVATTAFGMGIDKADVRFVVHWSLPKSFEGFYQEAGRAGRDGRAGLCLLFYGREERDRRLRLLHMDEMAGERRERGGGGGGKGGEAQREGRAKSLRQLVEYCEGTDRCRHRAIVAYFGEAEGAAVCDFACDWCKDAEGLRKRKEEGLASEEWVSTQREREDFYAAGYDDA